MAVVNRSTTARSKSLKQQVNSTLSHAQALVEKAHHWQFVELWVDPIVFPPKVLMLVCDQHGACQIYNPTTSYSLMFSGATYEDAQLWLLEDEYERVDGRLLAAEIA